MRTTLVLSITLALLCQLWGGDAIFFNLFRSNSTSNSTNSTSSFNPIGSIFGMGSRILGSFTSIFSGIFGRFGRSLDDHGALFDLILEAIESIDNDGCARRLVCEEAARSVQKGDDEKTTPSDRGLPFRSSFTDGKFESKGEVDLYYEEKIDEYGERILDFVRRVTRGDFLPGSSRDKWLSVVKFGEEGGDCALSQCPLSRTEILRDIYQRAPLQ